MQVTLCALALVAIVGWPPRSGALLLVPLGSAAAARVVPMAVAADARLLGRGPLPGSYVVEGDRGELGGTMLSAGILTLAAPTAGCTTGTA